MLCVLLLLSDFGDVEPVTGYLVDVAIADDGDLFAVRRDPPAVLRLQPVASPFEVALTARSTITGPLQAPRSIAIDDEGRVFVGDTATRTIYRLDADKLTPFASCLTPARLAVADETLYIANPSLQRLERFAIAGGKAGQPVAAARIRSVSSRGSSVFVLNAEGAVFELQGEKLTQEFTDEALLYPADLAALENGFLISDSYAGEVVRYDEDGQRVETLTPAKYPTALDVRGQILRVLDPKAKTAYRVELGDLAPVPANE